MNVIYMSEIQDKLSDLAKQVEEKLGIDKKEVFDQWEQELALVKKLRDDLTSIEQEQRAFLRLKGAWKKELRSPAKFYEGMVVRVATPMDVLRAMRTTAQTVYSNDPKKAIAQGLTDAQGAPLDPRKTFKSGAKNEDYGKPLPSERLIQNIVGVAKSTDMKAPVKFTMVLSERLAGKLTVPIFEPIKFRANPAKTQPTDGSIALNEYSNLKFKPAAIEGFPGPEAVLDKYFKENLVEVGEVSDWHKAHESDPRRMCIVCGDVDDVDYTPNQSTGNARLTLTDEDGDIEVVGWVPAHLRPVLKTIGKGSKVYALGRTAQNTYNNQERTMINIEGLWAIPKYLIAPDEVPEEVLSQAEEVM